MEDPEQEVKSVESQSVESYDNHIEDNQTDNQIVLARMALVEQTLKEAALAAKEDVLHVPEVVFAIRSYRLLEDCAEITCTVRVKCSKACDMTDISVLVTDNTTGDTFEKELTHFNGIDNYTDDFVLVTGNEPGRYSWTALSLFDESYYPRHQKVEDVLSFDYEPHAIGLNTWGIPVLFEGTRELTFSVGAQCSNFCSLARGKVVLYDENGVALSEALLRDRCFEGSGTLYWTEIYTSSPPQTEGAYHYQIRLSDVPDHEPVSSTVSIRVVKNPEHVLSLTVVAADTQAPICGAEARVHPNYRESDAEGKLQIPISAGLVNFRVKADGYLTRTYEIIMMGDAEFTVELYEMPDPELGENW